MGSLCFPVPALGPTLLARCSESLKHLLGNLCSIQTSVNSFLHWPVGLPAEQGWVTLFWASLLPTAFLPFSKENHHEEGRLSMNPVSTFYQLCDLGQISKPF